MWMAGESVPECGLLMVNEERDRDAFGPLSYLRLF
jgi:hypothetical protein